MQYVEKTDYYYGNEASQFSFYQLPKLLFTDDKYKGISILAKILYSFMLDRMSLSIKSEWFDKNGRVFIYFTLEEACEITGLGKTKMVQLLSELDTEKGIGLIHRVKQGQGKPTIIYVKSFTSSEKKSTPKNKKFANQTLVIK